MAVFLSYARDDADLAAVLFQELVELRGDVFMDREIRGGQDWWDQICDNIEIADLFVLLVSEASVVSDACQSECLHAVAALRPFLPVAAELTWVEQLPPEIKRFQAVQYDPHSKESYKQFMKAVTAFGEPPPPPDPLPPRPPLPESYAVDIRRKLSRQSMRFDDQVALFAVLRSHTDDPRRHKEAIALIGELRGRRDLAMHVAHDIDAFLAIADKPPGGTTPTGTAPPGTTVTTPPGATGLGATATAPPGSTAPPVVKPPVVRPPDVDPAPVAPPSHQTTPGPTAGPSPGPTPGPGYGTAAPVRPDLPPPPLATVELQRVKQSWLGTASKIWLEVDGKRIGGVDNGQTLRFAIPAGRHTLQATAWGESLGNKSQAHEVDVIPGTTLVLRVRFPTAMTPGIEMLRLA